MTQPSPVEKKKVRDGTYTQLNQMPRITREWALHEGYNQINNRIIPPINNQEHPFDNIVRDTLQNQHQ